MTAVPPPAPARSGGRWSTAAILKNVTSGWAGIVVGVVISFVLAPITVRALGNVYYGIWTLLMQFTGYLWLFDFGVRESVVKYVAQYEASDDREQITTTVRTAVTIYGLVSLATTTAACLLAVALPYAFNIPADTVSTARLTTILVGATVAQFFVFNVFVGVLMGLQRFYVLARLNIAFTILRGVLLYVLLSAGYGIVALSVVQFSMALISNLIVLRLARRALPYLSIAPLWPTRDEAMKLFNYGKYVFVANVGDKLVFASDSLVIGTFLPISALTYYAIGGSLIEQFRSFITSMASLINPMSSSLQAREDGAALATVVQTGVRAAILIGLPVGVAFMVIGRTFIGIWMGQEYAKPAGDLLAVLAVGHVLGLPYYTISGALYGLGRHRIIAQSRIFEGIVNLAMSIALVRSFGLMGVAVGTVVPHVVVVVAILPPVLARWVPIVLRDYYVATYVRPLLAALPFAAACWVIRYVVAPTDFIMFFASVALALVAYVIPVWFVALSPAERDRLIHAVRLRVRSRRTVEGLL